MENRRKIWRKFVEYSSSFWFSYPCGLCVLILNWSNNRKYVLGKDWLCSSKKTAPVLGNKLVRFWESWFGIWGFVEICGQFLGKSNTDFGEIRHRFWGNQSPDFEEISQDFGKISHQFWNKLAAFLIKTGSVFGEIRHVLGKSVTDFGEICHRFWENPLQTLRKSATELGEIRHRFWGNPQTGAVWWKIGLVFGLAWDKAQVSLFWTLSMFGFGFLRV